MLQAESCVLKFFEPLDRFIEIHRRRAEDLAPFLQSAHSLDSNRYRRALLCCCLNSYKEKIQPHLESLNALNPLSLQEYEEDLQNLIIEVNPDLRLDRVQIPALPKSEPAKGITHKMTRGLEQRLKNRLIGQNAAIDLVCWALKKAAVGLRNPRRPLGSFFFVGSTGVGKTQLARVIAEEVFGSDEALVRIDCSEYGLPHEVAKLTGAPPGYVGYEQGGVLTGAVARLKSCVVLFDEVEKADPKLHNTLLQILDDGILTDSAGKKISFQETLVILTGNVGAEDLNSRRRAPGFAKVRQQTLESREVSSTYLEALRSSFSPEFLNRLDELVVFRELDRNDVHLIARSMLGELTQRALTQRVNVETTEALVEAVAERGFSPIHGAREIRRTVSRLVEVPLVEALIKGTAMEGDSVALDWGPEGVRLAITKNS